MTDRKPFMSKKQRERVKAACAVAIVELKLGVTAGIGLLPATAAARAVDKNPTRQTVNLSDAELLGFARNVAKKMDESLGTELGEARMELAKAIAPFEFEEHA